MNIKYLLTGITIFTLAQILAWYQTNGQFISEWMKAHPRPAPMRRQLSPAKAPAIPEPRLPG